VTDQPLSERFVFWTPPDGFTVPTGPDASPLLLPAIPLPLHRSLAKDLPPSATAIGESVYDYLRQFPDCPHNRRYAELLQDGYPHLIADLGAQAAMLQHKDVSPAYVARMINQLRILALLEPANAGLLQQVGIASFDLAMSFECLPDCRSNLLLALGFFNRALKIWPDQPANLNYLGQINYLLGDYPAAQAFWEKLLTGLESRETRTAVAARISRLAAGDVPDYPLIDDLELLGQCLVLCGAADFAAAREILEDLDRKGWIAREFEFAEFPYLLGYCRSRTGDLAGALASYRLALEIDPAFHPAKEELALIQPGDA